jgi:hypothetical protein
MILGGVFNMSEANKIITGYYTTEGSNSNKKALAELGVPDPEDDMESDRILAKNAIGAKQNGNTTGDDRRTGSSSD